MYKINDVGYVPYNKNWSIYTEDKFDRLKYKFDGSDNIVNNYTQAFQDIFVLTMLNGKKNGNYLEIGTDNPVNISNTFLLESVFNWKGLSIDISKNEDFENIRKNSYLITDALNIDYLELLNNYKFSSQIDYLSLDIEPNYNTFGCLRKLPLDKFRFSVITFEHDFYGGDPYNVREESRKYLTSFGYKLVATNISNKGINYPFEDWYVDPNVISEDIYNLILNTNEETKYCENILLNE